MFELRKVASVPAPVYGDPQEIEKRRRQVNEPSLPAHGLDEIEYQIASRFPKPLCGCLQIEAERHGQRFMAKRLQGGRDGFDLCQDVPLIGRGAGTDVTVEYDNPHGTLNARIGSFPRRTP